MHQRLLERAFAALLLVWFTVLSGEPAALHSCPVHDVPLHAGHAAAHASHSHTAPEHGTSHKACTGIG